MWSLVRFTCDGFEIQYAGFNTNDDAMEFLSSIGATEWQIYEVSNDPVIQDVKPDTILD